LNLNVEGNDNVAIGNNALEKSLSKQNTAIGSTAGYNTTTGENNVFMGYRAGLTVTTGSNNILIGANVDTTSSGHNDVLNIGNAIKGRLNTKVIEIEKLKLTAVPTTAPSETGMLWRDGNTLKIS